MQSRVFAAITTILVLGTVAATGLAATVIPQTTAARFGLKRAWFAQVAAGQSTGPISYLNLEHGVLLVQTKRNLVSALNAETGRILWSSQVGPQHRLSTEPTVNDKFVAVVNGSVLYVLDRDNGAIAWQRSLTGSPGAGPAMTETHVFIPMLGGQIEGYQLDKGPKQTPWNYKSSGRLLIPPVTTAQALIWTTGKGHLYAADPVRLLIRFRLETRDVIHSRPAHWTPRVFACSTDGNVFAVNEADGKMDWKYSVGDAIYAPPVAIEDKVFVVSQFDGMYCLDAKHGTMLWNAPRIKQFMATSPTRVYVCDSTGRLAVLDVSSGNRLATMPLEAGGLRLINTESDRIYLATDRGVVQCLHEAALPAPLAYTPPPPPTKTSKPKTDEAAEPSEPSADAAMTDDPALDSEPPAMEEDKPEAPAEADADDPFK